MYICFHLRFGGIALEHLLLFKVVVLASKLPVSLRLQSDKIRSQQMGGSLPSDQCGVACCSRGRLGFEYKNDQFLSPCDF